VRGLLAIVLALWPLWPAAQEFPALYTVTDVADDDVLNIRDQPSATGRIVATLAPDAVDVEVLRLNDGGTWGWVGLPEGNGWASMQFLIRQETDIGLIPRPMRCLGTEPFWSVRLGADSQSFATPESDEPLALVSEAVAADGYLAFLHGVDSGLFTMTIARTSCSDGMSNRGYGFAVHLFHQSEGGTTFRSGCCMLTGG
jgi:uncharacterized membrane protein